MSARYKYSRIHMVSGSFVLLIISTIIAISTPKLSQTEIVIVNWVYQLPFFLTYPMLAVTQLGNLFFALFLMVVLTAAHKYRLALGVSLVATLAYAMVTVLKLVVHRPRPTDVLSDIVSREGLTYGYGFPSGHTALAVALGLTVVSIVPKRFRWVVYLLMILVGISRVYLGVHSPLDVVGGVCVGILASFAVRSIRRMAPFIKATS